MSVSSGFFKPAKEPVAARQIKRRPQVFARNVAGLALKRRQLLVVRLNVLLLLIHVVVVVVVVLCIHLNPVNLNQFFRVSI